MSIAFDTPYLYRLMSEKTIMFVVELNLHYSNPIEWTT